MALLSVRLQTAKVWLGTCRQGNTCRQCWTCGQWCCLRGMRRVGRSVSVSRCCFLCRSLSLCGPGSSQVPGSKLSVLCYSLCRDPAGTYPESGLSSSLSGRVKDVKSMDPLERGKGERGNGRSLIDFWTLLSFLPAGSLLSLS